MLNARLRHTPAVIAGFVVVGMAAAAIGIARSPDVGVVLPDPISRDFQAIMARDTLEVLASYNVGAGHVMDAQRLATADSGDATRWADVAYWLLQKSRAEVYNRPEVRHGYCRGLEPVQYVQRIMDRYTTYAQFPKDERA